MIDGRHQGTAGKARGDGVGVGHPRTIGRQVGPAGHLVETRHRAGVVTVAGHGGRRAGLTHQAGAEHDDAGVEFACDVVADAEAVDGAGRKAFHVDVGPGDQSLRYPDRHRVLELQRQPELGAVEVGVELGAVPAGNAVLEGAYAAQVVGPRFGLHSHDGRPVVGQVL